ncbi:unnamed protein product [Brachionus calyciflorus]|uniref:Amine oxidase domain-containing protein n=1 Tax=Brachionus calyciflorus TaxID=104777 RepID=A0A813TK65_9BILA|nr:unnamed protein product [Brachionus calyciflorus]
MNEDELIEDVLNQLTLIHGPIVRQEYMKTYYAFNWNDNQLSMGAFALYGPGQFTTSVHHGWILGTLNSGYRAVMEILMKEGMTTKLTELKKEMGRS